MENAELLHSRTVGWSRDGNFCLGREVLTSQIYFDELGGDRGFARSSEAAALQTVRLVQAGDDNLRASIDIVI